MKLAIVEAFPGIMGVQTTERKSMQFFTVGSQVFGIEFHAAVLMGSVRSRPSSDTAMG